MADAVDLGEVGEPGGRFNIDVFLSAVAGSGGQDWLHAAGYICKVTSKTTVGELRAALMATAGEKGKAVTSFMWGGSELVDEKTLPDNGVTLPGPMARKKGEKLDIQFAVDKMLAEGFDAGHERNEQNWCRFAEHMYEQEFEAPRSKLLAKLREDQRQVRARRAEEGALGRWIAQMGAPRDFPLVGSYVIMRDVPVESECGWESGVFRRMTAGTAVEIAEVASLRGGQRGRLESGGWITLIDTRQCIQYARFAGVRNDPVRNPHDHKQPRHFFEPCSDEAVTALERLLSATEGGVQNAKVVHAFHVDNTEMRYRYERLKTRMRTHAAPIKREPNVLTAAMARDRAFDVLGSYDASINENPLWHGTPSPVAIKGISDNGMDINFVQRTAFGLGFYFSDQGQTSWAFAGPGSHVGSEHIMCLFLCRVIVGRTRRQPAGVSSGESDRLRNELYDSSRGEGGLLDPDAQFHTLCAGNGNYFVIMDAMQCYPEFILFCKSK